MARTKTTSQKAIQGEKAGLSQINGQDKTPEKQPKEVEICSLPEKEFGIMIEMIQDLRSRMEMMQEMFTKNLEELKNK